MLYAVALCLQVAALVCAIALADEVSEARRDEHGVLVHTVHSDSQAGTTEIRVLLPTTRKEERSPVVYLLPVEARDGHRYGTDQGTAMRGC